MSELDLRTLAAVLSSVERAILAASEGGVREANEALERAEKRMREISLPGHSRQVRKTREAIEKLKAALRAPKAPTADERLDGIRPRAMRLRTAARACSRARATESP